MNRCKRLVPVVTALLAAICLFYIKSTGAPVLAGAAGNETKPITAAAVNALSETQREKYAGKFWRLDEEDKAALPKNFRMSTDGLNPERAGQMVTKGLEALRISGSAQMSAGELQVLAAQLLSAAGGAPVYLVDLRQETHGFADGQAISFYGKRNWGNIGKHTKDIIAEEAETFQNMQGENIDIFTLDADKNPQQPPAFAFQAEQTMTEAQAAASVGLNYFRLTSTDHIWTDDESIDRFIAFYKSLPENAWLHFHCEAGHGRTTTYMILYDILKNAGQVSLEDIAARQYLLGGTDVLQQYTSAGRKINWRLVFETERADKIRLFYQYVKENPQLNTRWSDWIQQHG